MAFWHPPAGRRSIPVPHTVFPLGLQGVLFTVIVLSGGAADSVQRAWIDIFPSQAGAGLCFSIAGALLAVLLRYRILPPLAALAYEVVLIAQLVDTRRVFTYPPDRAGLVWWTWIGSAALIAVVSLVDLYLDARESS